MTGTGRSSRWAATLALGMAGLIGGGAATVLAAPVARATASTFELTLEAELTPPLFYGLTEGTFRSRAPFCASGTFVDYVESNAVSTRLTCDDGTGGLTVAYPIGVPSTWQIVDGSGRYAGLRGKGSLRGEQLCGSGCDLGRPIPWRGTLLGVVDDDAVAPTIAFTRATATKLRRPAGTYALQLGIALRDDVADNPVTYTVRVCAYTVDACLELARSSGTHVTGSFLVTRRIRRPAGAWTVRLQLIGEDPVGNTVSVSRPLRLPR